jgi:hypothetical protein
MDYQPTVGESISYNVVGRVLGVQIDPMVRDSIIVDIELGDSKDPFIKNQRGQWDIPVQTGIGGGNT